MDAPETGERALSVGAYPLLVIFHLFPLHAPITLWLMDAPFGKFSWDSVLNLPAGIAWAVMECVSPAVFFATLKRLVPLDSLSWRTWILIGCYSVHYFHRALLSPLYLAPKRAPLHLVVVLAAFIFNGLNGSLLAYQFAQLQPRTGLLYWAGIALWALGFYGNVYHDELLHDLRRPPEQRRVSKSKAKPQKYAVPHGGLFEYISFPNYFCEWLEWSGFALAAGPLLVPVPPLSSMGRYALRLTPLGKLWPTHLLAPAWAFVLAEVTSMLPRALRGHAWYRRTFDYPPRRKAAIPFIL
ncbi:3-oxo-5-alpha-steroid 4-dehydrogenase [Trichosporon asahii var. asahii CBS 2479]|uniref:3-oxo-5-alpha-steroid 4-dehydrogenase n=1 Tax=Trichosporon asahii var. asahii (strain ATCC 90039 / CBS 2479 / JCM 2466 / KCTC 7840 / NBRC 103889/ NCYC 2677 / UAMH 7654) TaxID=1186058 RepID=J5TAZ6_TRIAS|nr:3-oxo-5-alpha-steroid 4-dehydrogenase [Trichosporon asahii var. asahii CBS 2479]EJT50041.1 3-oxo-5-alpha-steroid 4-dehydrogenase [Trichosporon asahii var. asahii CBS 2479]